MNKFLRTIALSILACCSVTIWAQQYNGAILVNSHTLTEKNDQLNLSIDLLVKKNSVEDFAAMRLIPELLTDSNRYTFPDMVIQGNNKRKTYNRWLRTMSKKYKEDYVAPASLIRVNSETDTLLTFHYQSPYEMWMDDAVLVCNQELISFNDSRSLIVFALNGRVKLEPRIPYEVQPLVSFTEPKPEQKNRKKQGQAFLDFKVGRSEIIPGFRRNPVELEKIRKAFAEIETNEDVKINGLFIEGYASPDGRYETNVRLAAQRAEALKNHIVKSHNLPISNDKIRVASVPEDWDGLKVLLEASTIARKEQVMAVIDENEDIVRRKQRIQAIGGGSVYRAMLTELYPQLRRVEYQIDFSVKDYGVEEAKGLISKSPELLSQRELYLTAMSYSPESKEYENIMIDIIPHQFKDDAIAQINAASLMIRRGEMSAARRVLERYQDDPAAWNNLGVLELYAGELDKAEELLAKAAQSGVTEAKHNLEELNKKRADNEKMKRFVNEKVE